MSLLEIAAKHAGRRHKITRQEMAAILMDYSRQHPGALANGYVIGTFPDDTPEPGATDEEWDATWASQGDDYHRAAAETWARVVRGITLVSAGDGRAGAPDGSTLRDGGVRYDQPGSMAPCQMAVLIFAGDTQRPETISYLRGHCRRLFLVREDSVIAPPPPPEPKPEHEALHAKWQAGVQARKTRFTEESRRFEEEGIDDHLPVTAEEKAVRYLLDIVAWEEWPRDPAVVDNAIARMAELEAMNDEDRRVAEMAERFDRLRSKQ